MGPASDRGSVSIADAEHYSIRLCEVDSNGEMLDWLYQLQKKYG